MSKITVLAAEPEKKPYVKNIDNMLASLQSEVGRCIRYYPIIPYESIDVNSLTKDDNMM